MYKYTLTVLGGKLDNIERLNKKSVYELRIIGRNIGVKSVTTLKKSELISKINGIQNGKPADTISKRGRRALTVGLDELFKPTVNNRQIQLIEKAFSEFKEQIIKIIENG